MLVALLCPPRGLGDRSLTRGPATRPSLSQGALQSSFPGSFPHWEDPPPQGDGGPCWALPLCEPGPQEWVQGPLLLGVAAVGDLGPPTPLGDGPAGAAGSRTERLSNFLASVMCTQLSFSTTLMCFTSSLNLGRAHGSAGHYASHTAPGPPGVQAYCMFAERRPRPSAHTSCSCGCNLSPRPGQGLSPTACPSIHHATRLKPKLPGQPRPQAPKLPSSPPSSDAVMSCPGFHLFSALGMSPSPFPHHLVRLSQHGL